MTGKRRVERTEPTRHAGIRKRIWDNGSVTYQVRWTSKNGQPQSGSRDTLAEAIHLSDEMRNQRRLGGPADAAGARIAYGDRWEDWFSTRDVRSSTSDRDRSYYRNHIEPVWARVRVCDITDTDVKRWLMELKESDVRPGQGDPSKPAKKLAPATRKKIYETFTKPIREMVASGRLLGNPLEGVKPPKVAKYESRFLKPAELARIYEAMTEYDADTVAFMVDTGVRIGEMAALRVDDVNFLQGTVRVTRTVTFEHGRRTEGPPKSDASVRKIPTLTAAVAERLAARVTAQGLGRGDHLFTAPNGGHIHPGNWRRRVWDAAVEAAEIEGEKPTPHALRHTAISLWIASGVDPQRVKKWGGHESITTTYDRYGHLFPEDASEVREMLDSIRQAAQEKHEEQTRNQVSDLDDERERRKNGKTGTD